MAQEVLVVGAYRMQGKSKANGSDFDLYRMVLLTPGESVNGKLLKISAGFAPKEVKLSPLLLNMLLAESFPFYAEVTLETDLGSFRPEPLVSAYRVTGRLTGEVERVGDKAEAKGAGSAKGSALPAGVSQG